MWDRQNEGGSPTLLADGSDAPCLNMSKLTGPVLNMRRVTAAGGGEVLCSVHIVHIQASLNRTDSTLSTRLRPSYRFTAAQLLLELNPV